MPGIIINNLDGERKFTDYHKRRGELRDALRFGVYPNLKRAIELYNSFVADYGPDGELYEKEIWDYYTTQIEPIASVQAGMMAGAVAIVAAMEQVEAAAPGTFGT
ncbi:MAG: hypothetical protein KAX65_14795 [Caldilineaceae bacterium]|nr:hypothetical protein [Caldilineaceae bacterium]